MTRETSDGARRTPAGALAGRRILIVEDERLVALFSRDLLEGWGCEVVGPVDSVPAALALIGAGPLDAALLDADLHGEGSGPVAAALAATARPFLVTTAFPPEHLDPALARGRVLGKPVPAATLERALIELLER